MTAALSRKPGPVPIPVEERPVAELMAKSPSDCGVAAIVSNRFIPSHVMDLMLDQMANRGMDGVGIWKGGCYSHHMDHYAFHVLVKGTLQAEVEEKLRAGSPGPERGRGPAKGETGRPGLPEGVHERAHGPVFQGPGGRRLRRTIWRNAASPIRGTRRDEEQDFRNYGEKDPGDVFLFLVRVKKEELHRFIEKELWNDPIWPCRQMRFGHLTINNYGENTEFLQEAEDEYIYRLSQKITREHYTEAQPKRAAVMSCGKNSGCWKTDGQQIPWEIPDAPVNIIHRRLATGSVVDQMNAHPFAELHTALTHNGETTNYRTMLNRISHFNLKPLAQTDTAVASLKLHLVSQYLHYPFRCPRRVFLADDRLCPDPAPSRGPGAL